MYQTKDLLDYQHSLAAELLADCLYPWEALPRLKEFILKLAPSLNSDFQEVAPQIWVHKTTIIAPSAQLLAPLIIAANCEIRQGAFLRGSIIVGEACVVGNSSELKNSLLLSNVQIPHFNYAGDSIFGRGSHMGAGSITSNVKADKSLICVKDGSHSYPTGLKKFGAVLGDYVEVGCNAVLNPGTIVGRHSRIYPLTMVRGLIPASSIVKSMADIVSIK